jgi:hypothetical protein
MENVTNIPPLGENNTNSNSTKNFLKKIIQEIPIPIASTNVTDVMMNMPTNVTTIESINTKIMFNKDISDGFVSERIIYNLKNGIFNQLIHKISLGGTTLRHFDIKLATQDVKLQSARIVRDCYEGLSIYEHPYICVITNFDEIDLTNNQNKTIKIDFEYIAEGLLRQREKPFQKSKENILIWIYDNHNNRDSEIKEVTLSIDFDNKVSDMKIYPERYIMTNTNDTTSIVFNTTSVKANDYQNFAINMPLFNSHSKEMVNLNLIKE